MTCVNASRAYLRQQNSISHEGRYRHVEKTFSPSDPDLHSSHCTAASDRTKPPQPPVPPQGYYGPGPWHHMWGDGYGWHFWWMFPLMMLCMIVIFAVIFFLARGFCGHGCHHWGPPSLMRGDPSHWRCRYSTNALLAAKFRRTSTRRKRLRSFRDSISKRIPRSSRPSTPALELWHD